MSDYLAYTCAINGELDLALHEETISKELYEGAGQIILGLLSGIAHPDIGDYPYAGTVLARFVYHAQMHCETIDDFYPLMKISEFLDDVEANEEEQNLAFNGYHSIHSIREALTPIIKNPVWSKLAVKDLKDNYNFRALEIAHFYDIDVMEQLFFWLGKFPVDEELYSAIMDTNYRQHIERLCTFAEAHLSLSSLSDNEQDCLQYIVQGLDEHEGVGQVLIQAALESNNGSLQYQALRVLSEWSPIFAQKPSIQELARKIANTTRDKEDRQLARSLLKK